MSDKRKILVCSCEDTMPLDRDALTRGCRGAELVTGRQFCRAELDRFRTLAGIGAPLTIGCTQEEPLFREVAGDTGTDLRFVNLREAAGWSGEAAKTGPKMAALAAAAAEPTPAVSYVPLESAGVALVYGSNERAFEAAGLLKDHLDITVLLTNPGDVTPPRQTEFPVVKGTIRVAKGHLGAFEVVVDEYATPLPSSQARLTFGPARNGAISRCDIVLDLSGGAPLFPAPDLRDGHVRADPGDLAAVLRAVLRARDLVGGFDKPRYVAFDGDLCAHSRSGIVGCHRCLDLCPAGAIAPAGDCVAIDAAVCAGCGQCAAACPTGAAGYALPPAEDLLRRLRTLLTVYGEAGGAEPVVLLHDGEHGGALIDALARHGDGLPANVLPLAVNEVTQVGLECVAAAFAYGAVAVRLLLRGRPRHDPAGLYQTIALAEAVLSGIDLGAARVAAIETDDPFALGDALREAAPGAPVPRPARFDPVGGRRELLRLSLRELHRAASATAEVIALPSGAPLGAVAVAEGCTLCLACVSACPTGALSDDPERPILRFSEEACVQCGLCKATCPEKVITLEPRFAVGAAAQPRVLREEEPFRCIRCNKPFGVKSTIDRIVAKLEGAHWMYQRDPRRLELIKMCEDCRVVTVSRDSLDPHSGPPRPRLRTTDDYLREREPDA